MRYLFLCLSLFYGLSTKAQDVIKSSNNIFNKSLYPADSFIVGQKNFKLGKSEITIHLVQHLYPPDDYSSICERWVEQRLDGKIIKTKYFYFNEGENNFNYVDPQPISKYFIFSNQREFTGIFYLIKENGIWIELPGCNLSFDKKKNILYTSTPDECGKCDVAKFEINSEKKTIGSSENNIFNWKEVDMKSLINVTPENDLILK